MVSEERYKNLKYVKGISSFWRSTFQTIINIYKQRFYQVKEKDSLYRLKMSTNMYLAKDSEEYKEFQNLISIRMNRRISAMECFHSTIRLTLLWFSLKFPK